MKKKLTLLLVFSLVISALFAGCAKQEAAPAESSSGDAAEPVKKDKIFVTIATGGSSGAYFALGGTVATLLNEKLDYVNASVQSTGASAVNATLLGEQKAELAFAMNDVVNYAYTGTESFAEKGKIENLRGLASLYPNFVQAITLEGTGINSIADLKGKRVGVGAPGSGTEVNARQILAAYGLTYDDIDEDFLSYAEAVEQMKNGAVDAAFLTSGIPNASIMDLATTKDVKIIPIEKANVENLAKEFPFYSSQFIPADTYGNAESVETAAVMTLLVTRSELPDDVVYDITKTIFENLDSLAATHASGKEINLEGVETGMPIPFHPGATKYFEEVK